MTNRAGMAGIAVVLLLAAGCADPTTTSADPSTDEEASSSAETSGAPSDGASAGSDSSGAVDSSGRPPLARTAGMVLPQLPAPERSEAGAEAFARYVVQSAYYAFTVNDARMLNDVVVGDDCVRCRAVTKAVDVRRDRGLQPEYRSRFAIRDAQYEGRTGDTWSVYVDVERPAYDLVDGAGKVVSTEYGEPLASEEVTLRWVDGRWRLVELVGFVDD